jgi:cytochrome bd ubiquinol oxidase subunit I
MEGLDVASLSRLQFALTALYHFLFVPLTLGLVWLLAIMESVYVMTGRTVWRDATKFWGTLFGINFAMGVATGVTMEFQFGTNWSYYSHYVGDVFGTPLAIEGIVAFFLEATFVGLFFFGWNRLTKVQHLATTWLVALGSNLSALWILVANSWMLNPVGAQFNPQTMRMELTSFSEVLFNPVAQSKFLHTVSAGYVTGAMFVLSISAYYILRARHLDIARRSFTVAASFGLASALSVVVLGDESGYTTGLNQKMKIAAIEAMWETQPPPASFTLFGVPDLKTESTKYAVEVPWLLGLIATRSLDTPVEGIHSIVKKTEQRIRNGLPAYVWLREAGGGSAPIPPELKASFDDLGYAFLLKGVRPDAENATLQDVKEAAHSVIPNVPVLFWAFRIMVALGFYFIALFGVAFYLSSRRRIRSPHLFLRAALYNQPAPRIAWLSKHFLRIAFYSLPLPWVAAELGWIVAEYGRQPWIIDGVMPTFLGVSNIPAGNVWASLIGFLIFYSALAIVDVGLILKYVRLGPEEEGPAPAAAPTAVAAAE